MKSRNMNLNDTYFDIESRNRYLFYLSVPTEWLQKLSIRRPKKNRNAQKTYTIIRNSVAKRYQTSAQRFKKCTLKLEMHWNWRSNRFFEQQKILWIKCFQSKLQTISIPILYLLITELMAILINNSLTELMKERSQTYSHSNYVNNNLQLKPNWPEIWR